MLIFNVEASGEEKQAFYIIKKKSVQALGCERSGPITIV